MMMRTMWHLGLLSFVAMTSCRAKDPSTQTETKGFVNLATEAKPFSKMRSATELHVLRAGFTNDAVVRTAMQAHKTPIAALRNVMMRQILAIEGVPRVQLKGVLENLLDSHSTACAGVPCGRVFELSHDKIDTFLDESLDTVVKTETKLESEKSKELLVSSLMRDESGVKPSWTITLVPDPDSKLWMEKTPYSAALYPDFPVKAGETTDITWTSDLHASVTWGPKHEEQFASWKKEFDDVEDCATRGLKRGKVYATFNDCLADATLDEQQYLSAKLVFHDVEAKLAKTDGKTNPRRHFRAIFDKDGNMQCLVVTNKMPSMSYYSSLYRGAVPTGAAQIPALEVMYLLAAPWNLKHDHPKRVKGAGTACLGIAALESKRGPWAGRILLEGSPSAVPYYQKLGFTAIGEDYDQRYGLLPAMWLEPKDSFKLIPEALH